MGYFLYPLVIAGTPVHQIRLAEEGKTWIPADQRRDRGGFASAEDGRGDRVSRSDDAAALGDRISAGADRPTERFRIDDRHSLTWRAPAMWLPQRTEWHEHLLAPAKIAMVQAAFALRDTMTTSRWRKFARFHLSAVSRSPAQEPALPSTPAYAALPEEVPLPSLRPEGEADGNVYAGGVAPDERANAVPLPSPRPQIAARDEVTLASLKPQSRPTPTRDDAATSNITELPAQAPLPPTRSARQAAAPQQQASTQLAYAPPVAADEDRGGILGRLFGPNTRQQLPGPGSGIAVYDIKAATVHLPNGERLEAHSGLGHMKDDPRYADEKNRGPTPPNVYNLVMRERRFHGVEAIRLLPSDGRKEYNRDGLLAHTYMYAGGGSPSQSNGCVVFKDYERFLKAFKRGRITRMIVVPSMDELPTYMAQL